jgi:DNA repair protein RAD5
MIQRARRFITLPFLARDPKAVEIVQVILENTLLRREKNMLDLDGKRIVELPPKEVRHSCCRVFFLRKSFLC